MSKILANQIANYGDDSPIELKEGLNIPADKPLQAAGASGSNGQVLTSTGSTVQWTTPFDGDYNSLSNRPTIPAAQVNSDWNAVGTVSEILNKPVIPAVPSINTLPASGGGSLSYNSGNGEFAFTPANLSSFLTAEIDTLDSVTSRSSDTQNAITVGGLSVSNDGSDNGKIEIVDNGAYSQISWYDSLGNPGPSIQGVATNIYMNVGGGHVRVGGQGTIFYGDGNIELNKTTPVNSTTTFYNGFTIAGGTVSGIDIEDLDNVDVSSGLSDQQVLKWNAANSAWEPANDLVGGAQGVALTDLSVSTAAAGTAALSYNNTNGVFTYTPPDLSGYLTSFTETDPVFAASAAANVTLTKINQWDTAYGWGNHANGGYLVATAQDKTNWNTAFGWGDHSLAGYLTSETDPVFSASTAAGITGAEVANWNTAYGWGDHSTAGYLTSTGSISTHTDVTITTPVNGEVLAYNGSQWVNTNAASIANATISDTAPGSPNAGDLWWESDKGRLKIYYNDTDSQQWVDASPPLAQPNVPVVAGCINMNANSPTWTGTTGYTVAKSGGDGSALGGDVFYTLTFPTAYSARTDYIVQASYDGTDWVSANGAQIGIERNAANVVFCVRRWNEDPLNLGDIMVTITNL